MKLTKLRWHTDTNTGEHPFTYFVLTKVGEQAFRWEAVGSLQSLGYQVDLVRVIGDGPSAEHRMNGLAVCPTLLSAKVAIRHAAHSLGHTWEK